MVAEYTLSQQGYRVLLPWKMVESQESRTHQVYQEHERLEKCRRNSKEKDSKR